MSEVQLASRALTSCCHILVRKEIWAIKVTDGKNKPSCGLVKKSFGSSLSSGSTHHHRGEVTSDYGGSLNWEEGFCPPGALLSTCFLIWISGALKGMVVILPPLGPSLRTRVLQISSILKFCTFEVLIWEVPGDLLPGRLPNRKISSGFALGQHALA